MRHSSWFDLHHTNASVQRDDGEYFPLSSPFGQNHTGSTDPCVRSDRFISSQIVVAFHEAMIISCCEDGILMLWGTQIKSSIQGEDWTPVVLHNKARFLSLVSGVSTGIGRSSTLSSSSLTRFNGFKSKRKRSSGSKSSIYIRWRPATWLTCNGERPCRTTNGAITRIKSNGSCSRRTRSDEVSKESTPI